MMAWLILLVACIRLEIADCRENGHDVGYRACMGYGDESEAREQIATQGCLEAWDEGYAEGVAECENDTD